MAAASLACLALGSWAAAQDARAPKAKPGPEAKPAAAESTKAAAAAPNYGDLIKQAGENFAPLTDKEVAAAKSRLAAAVRKLNAYLDNNGPHGAGWKKYFGWEDLTAQLAAGAKPNVSTLLKIRGKFFADHEGLDWPIYANVGDRLSEYIDVVGYSSAQDQKALYAAQLKSLGEDLDAYGKKPTELGAFAIGARLGYLKATGRANELVAAVHNNLSQNNLDIQASEALVAAGLSRDIDQTTPIYDYILGANISGTGRTVGKLNVELAESEKAALIKTKMIATVNSNTVGQKGPATVWSKGTTSVRATKPLKFTGERLTTEPASVSATTSTEFQGLSVRPRFLQKAAWRKAYKSKPTAEYIAARHAEWRVQEKMDSEARETIAETNKKIDDRFRLSLLRLRAYPQSLAVKSNTERISITALQADGSQLAAPTAAPKLDGDSDLAVRVHETMLNNLAARTLAGNTYNDEQLKAALKDITGKVPKELEDSEDKDPWSITFTKVRPIIFEFDGEHFSLTIQGSDYTSGDREYKEMNIAVKYKMEKTDKGSKLTRVGEIQFAPPGHEPGKTLSAQQIALRTILQKKLKNAFKPVIESDGLQLGGKFKDVGKLRLTQLASDAGWLTLAWKLPSQQAAATADASKAKASEVVSK
jgi:hypothetical protein